MAKTDALAQLKDIHLPAPISWWPLAPGWYVLLVLFLLMIMGGFYWAYKKHQNARAKKDALVLLQRYKKEYEATHNGALASARVSELLRRVALVYYPRSRVASIHGEAWIEFLNQTAKGVDFKPVQAMLLECPYQAKASVQVKPLLVRAELWIKQRGVPCSN